MQHQYEPTDRHEQQDPSRAPPPAIVDSARDDAPGDAKGSPDELALEEEERRAVTRVGGDGGRGQDHDQTEPEKDPGDQDHEEIRARTRSRTRACLLRCPGALPDPALRKLDDRHLVPSPVSVGPAPASSRLTAARNACPRALYSAN